jgi:DNA-3-methyladenine glycosylase II
VPAARPGAPRARAVARPVQRAVLALGAPFRLDLTVALLQRLPQHPVEVWDGGRYLRAFETPAGPVAWVVRQPPRSAAVEVELRGPAGDPALWLRRLERALGAGAAPAAARFRRRSRAFPALAAMVRTGRGARPPRFQSLPEAYLSVLLFQQVSLASAVATLRRVVLAASRSVELDGVVLHPFPAAEELAALPEEALRRAGMSGAKARALRGALAAVAGGGFDEARLEALPSDALEERLRALPGVGPWSAALLLLRGFGRLDRFPPGDAAADRLLQRLGGRAEGRALLEALGEVRGLLYYHLFLDRLAREGRGPFAPGAPHQG